MKYNHKYIKVIKIIAILFFLIWIKKIYEESTNRDALQYIEDSAFRVDDNDTWGDQIKKYGYSLSYGALEKKYQDGLSLYKDEEIGKNVKTNRKVLDSKITLRHIFDYKSKNISFDKKAYYVFVYKNYFKPNYKKTTDKEEMDSINKKLYCSGKNRYAILDLRTNPHNFLDNLDKAQLTEKMKQMNIDINISKFKKEPSECAK